MSKVVINKENSTALKALCCILIVLHHHFQASGIMRGTVVSAFFITICGYVSVAVFFFLSGYGITEAEQNAVLTWKQFFKKRIRRVYAPFVLTNFLFLLSLLSLSQYSGDWIMGVKHTMGIELIDSITWFVPVLLIFYVFAQLLTYLQSHFFKILGMGTLTATYVILGFTVLNIPFYAIVSVPAFLVGYSVSLYKQTIVEILLSSTIRFLFFLMGIVGSLFFSAITMGYVIFTPHILHLAIALNNICVLVVIIAIFTGQDLYWFKCNWLGNISYEVYLTHAKVFTIWTIVKGCFIPLWALVMILPIAFVTYKINMKVLTILK